MRGSRRCLRRCRARRSTAQYIRFGGFDGIWALWANLNPPGVRFDVEAGASEASGRARISGLIGLLMRPCKAKGVIGLVAIHVEPAYLSVFLLLTFFFFFSSFHLHLFDSANKKGRVFIQAHLLGSDTMGSVGLIPQIPLYRRHIYTFLSFLFSFTLFYFCHEKQLSLYTPTWQLCYILAQIHSDDGNPSRGMK